MSIGGFEVVGLRGQICQLVGLTSECFWAKFEGVKMTHFKIDIQVHGMKKHKTNWHKKSFSSSSNII